MKTLLIAALAAFATCALNATPVQMDAANTGNLLQNITVATTSLTIGPSGTLILNGSVTGTGSFSLSAVSAINITATGTSTLSGGIVSTATSSSAAAGIVGQYQTALVAVGSGQALATASATRSTSISLGPGDWSVTGTGTFVAAAATVTQTTVALSTTSNSVPATGIESYGDIDFTTTSLTYSVPVVQQQFSFSTTTSVYLVSKVTFSAGSVSFSGNITARLVR